MEIPPFGKALDSLPITRNTYSTKTQSFRETVPPSFCNYNMARVGADGPRKQRIACNSNSNIFEGSIDLNKKTGTISLVLSNAQLRVQKWRSCAQPLYVLAYKDVAV